MRHETQGYHGRIRKRRSRNLHFLARRDSEIPIEDKKTRIIGASVTSNRNQMDTTPSLMEILLLFGAIGFGVLSVIVATVEWISWPQRGFLGIAVALIGLFQVMMFFVIYLRRGI
jgi:hypothetical protein